MQRPSRTFQAGVTLIELMVVVALVVIVLAVVAPSFKRFIDTQRVSNTNAMVVTDMQLARSEAASRGARVRVSFRFNTTLTCYSIYTYVNPGVSCDCRLSAPCAAAGAGYVEIKTTRVPRDTGVLVFPDLTPGPTGLPAPAEFAFEPLAGGLYTIPQDIAYDILSSFTIRTFIDAQRMLRTVISQSGRPSVCAPTGSTMREVAC